VRRCSSPFSFVFGNNGVAGKSRKLAEIVSMTAHAAIIGYSFRLPGTDSNCFWQDLLQERDLVTAVDPQRWALDSFLHPRRAHPGTS
jgi:hypothetical protein